MQSTFKTTQNPNVDWIIKLIELAGTQGAITSDNRTHLQAMYAEAFNLLPPLHSIRHPQNKRSLLEQLAISGDIEGIKSIFESKVSGIATEAKSLFDYSGNSLMHLAAANPMEKISIEMMKYLNTAQGLRYDILNKTGNQPIHVAAIRGNAEIFKFLVATNPALSFVPRYDGKLPYDLGLEHKQLSIIAMGTAKPAAAADPKSTNNSVVDYINDLNDRIQLNIPLSTELTDFILGSYKTNNGMLPSLHSIKSSQHGRTLLQQLIFCGDLNAAQIILESKIEGVACDAKSIFDFSGNSLMHLAALQKENKSATAILEYLNIVHGLRFDVHHPDGGRPITATAFSGHCDAYLYLSAPERGDQRTRYDTARYDGFTPLQIALHFKHADLLALMPTFVAPSTVPDAKTEAGPQPLVALPLPVAGSNKRKTPASKTNQQAQPKGKAKSKAKSKATPKKKNQTTSSTVLMHQGLNLETPPTPASPIPLLAMDASVDEVIDDGRTSILPLVAAGDSSLLDELNMTPRSP